MSKFLNTCNELLRLTKGRLGCFYNRSPFWFIVLFSLLFFGILLWLIFTALSIFTKHGEYTIVPNIKKKSPAEVQIILSELNLNYEVLDSAAFDASIPKYAVVEQNPPAGSKVKEDRKIYLTVNPSKHRKVKMPNVIQLTIRNAEPLLLSSGLKLGQIIYVPNIGKDVVLAAFCKGKKIEPGTNVFEASQIDLECGNGN